MVRSAPRFDRRAVYRFACAAGALLALLATPAAAGPRAGAAARCPAPSYQLLWPEERPVWELCWTRPRDSSGPGSIDGASTRPAGSGLELTGVRYRGLPVLERAQAPVVWARWADRGEPGCAGRCQRAPMSVESPFAAGAEVVPGWYEPDPPPSPESPAPLWPLVTVCDRPPGAPPSGATAPGDCPWGEPLACVTGVSVDRGEERLTLTTQLAAGELRYVMSWTFHFDGTFEPRFGFARGGTACAGTPVREHVVWRLDVDLRGDERLLAAGDGDGWRVADAAGRGFRIVPGAGDLEPALHASAGAADPFAGLTGGCGFDPGALPPYAGTDLVLWYHAAAEGAGTGCRTVGPTLTPFGRWPLGEPIFESGFESGDLEQWSTSQSRVEEPIFEDGFESGDLEQWSTGQKDP